MPGSLAAVAAPLLEGEPCTLAAIIALQEMTDDALCCCKATIHMVGCSCSLGPTTALQGKMVSCGSAGRKQPGYFYVLPGKMQLPT